MIFMMPMPPTISENRGDCGEHERHDARRWLLSGEDFLHIPDGKIVVFSGLEMMALAAGLEPHLGLH
jgi:hypothetical protein